MKWIYRPSVTEMDSGGVYEMERQTKCKKLEMPLKWMTSSKICWTGTRMSYQILNNFSGCSFFFGTLSVYLFHRYHIYPYL